MEEVKIYELPNYAFNKYKQLTGDRDCTLELARRKLSRMIHLGLPVKKDHTYHQTMYLFDELRIRVNLTIDGREIITGLWQLGEPIYGWNLNMKKYKKVSKKLGLEVK